MKTSIYVLVLTALAVVFIGCTTPASSGARKPASVGKGATIVLDPGHGGKNRGAQRGGVDEANVTLEICRAAKPLLEKAGYYVIMTRTEDIDLSLSQRVAISNRYPGAKFISVHCDDGGSARGCSAYYLSPDSAPLAHSCRNALSAQAGIPVFGAGEFRRYLGVLTKNENVSILLEVDFLSNRQARANLTNPAYRKVVAAAITDGAVSEELGGYSNVAYLDDPLVNYGTKADRKIGRHKGRASRLTASL